MQITDPIADLLTRIRNASTAKHPSVEIPASNMKKAICQILVDEGYVKSMQVKNDTVQGTIVLNLKYQANGEPVLAGLKRVESQHSGRGIGNTLAVVVDRAVGRMEYAAAGLEHQTAVVRTETLEVTRITLVVEHD